MAMSLGESRSKAKREKMVKMWNSESWGPMRANQLWSKAKKECFTSKTEFYTALNLLRKDGILTKTVRSHKRVWYYLSDDYQIITATMSRLTQSINSLSIPKEFSVGDSSTERYGKVSLYLFSILVELSKWMEGVPVVHAANPRFREVAKSAFWTYFQSAMAKLLEVGRRYPESTDSSIALVNSVMEAVLLDLYQIVTHHEYQIGVEKQEAIQRARRDLSMFRSGKPMELLLINDLAPRT